MLFWGKFLELIGALLLAVPVFKAAYYDIRYKRLLDKHAPNKELESIDRDFKKRVEELKMHFSRLDAFSILFGAIFFVLGSVVYLFGLAVAAPH